MTSSFKKRVLLFSAILIVVNFLLDQGFKYFSVHNIVNEKMDEQFAEYDDTLKYLAMGNSHNCINTHMLPQSFNYGSPSENYIQSYYKLKHILERTGKKPQYLLLQADLSSFTSKSADRYEYNSYWIKYLDYVELAKVKKQRGVLFKWLEGKFFSYAGNYKDIQLSIVYRIKMKTLEMYNGYRPHRDYHNFANEKNRQRSAWEKAQHILTNDSYFDPAIRYYFDNILSLCQENNIKVILIRYPLSKEFSFEERRIIPADILTNEVEKIAHKYSVYCGTLDYHDIFFDHPEYFFDPDHLNVRGSDLFSEKFVKDLYLMIDDKLIN
jgi:hypothetical protein